MKVTVERTPESEAVLNVELDWAELETASNRAYQKLAQKYNVPGFRKGHAPRSMLERMLGKEAIYQEGLEDLIERSYRDAVRENDLTPLGQPHVDAPPIEIGQPYHFSAHVPILTPVTLGDYTSIRVAEPPVEVTDTEVEETLERIRQNEAMWLPADRPAQYGDRVTVDLLLTAGERQVSNLHDNEFELSEEREGIFAGMDQQLIGTREGEQKTFTTSIPEGYANTELAGKEASYDVTMKAVKYRELPALDDELAKTVGDYSTLDEVRGAIREQLRTQKEGDARRKQRDEVTQALVDMAEVSIHPLLVEDEADVMIRETRRLLEQNRIAFDQYLAATGKNEQEYRSEIEPEARERVKRDLALTAVADAEGITVDDQEAQEWLDILNSVGGGKPMRLRQLSAGQRATIEGRIKRDRALARLIEIATQDSPQSSAPSETDGEASETADEADAETSATIAAAVGETLATEEIAEIEAAATPDASDVTPDAATPDAVTTDAEASAQATSESEAQAETETGTSTHTMGATQATSHATSHATSQAASAKATGAATDAAANTEVPETGA
ncbi:MAG: trigger factor [Ktedonobacterales bacterium]